MPRGKDLPENLKEILPEHAQLIYKSARDNALEQYKDPKSRRGKESREETANKVAWAAVKQKYEKGSDEKWHPKDANGGQKK
jgi:cation transport regulator